MAEESLISKADWPRWTWRESSWWLTAIGAVIALLLILYPLLISYPLWLRMLVGFASLLSPILILALIFSLKVATVALDRIHGYKQLYELSEQRTKEVAQAQETILYFLRELLGGRSFEIEKVQYYKDRLTLILKKKRGVTLEAGNEIRVIDTLEGVVMGIFEISEVRSKHYIARSQGSVNAVWLGYIHESGNAESSAPPDTAAIFFPKDVSNNER
ncbi:MAG TPA: hypothetical protein VGC91_07170 [Pyrinomonadaceae bacterium]|jgi:hypothetical protein